MLRRLILLAPMVLAATLLYSASAHADCLLPAPPSHIPDGDSANQQEMVAAMRTFKQYNDDVDEYTKCLDFEQRQNHISNDAQMIRRNIALSQLEAMVAKFNEQVRRFKARHT
jgi:ribonuclease BN (tRNA processing enzyme)